jgi:hypothetical protein
MKFCKKLDNNVVMHRLGLVEPLGGINVDEYGRRRPRRRSPRGRARPGGPHGLPTKHSRGASGRTQFEPNISNPKTKMIQSVPSFDPS